MAGIILSSLNKPSISVNGKKETNHANLKNLSFEESGHTGFQSELTQEQIKNIADVVRKEDLSNKVHKVEYIGEDDNTYPSSSAVYKHVIQEGQKLEQSIVDKYIEPLSGVEGKADAIAQEVDALKGEVASCGDWELFKSGTLTEDVEQLSWSDLPKCKELYIYFRVPTLNPDGTTDFPKGRIFLYNATNILIENCIYYERSPYFTDTGKTWRAGYHVQMYGTICTTERMYDESMTSAATMYNLGYNQYYSKAFGKKFDNPYIEHLTALMYPSGTRYFPVGTEYEIWGVKA